MNSVADNFLITTKHLQEHYRRVQNYIPMGDNPDDITSGIDAVLFLEEPTTRIDAQGYSYEGHNYIQWTSAESADYWNPVQNAGRPVKSFIFIYPNTENDNRTTLESWFQGSNYIEPILKGSGTCVCLTEDGKEMNFEFQEIHNQIGNTGTEDKSDGYMVWDLRNSNSQISIAFLDLPSTASPFYKTHVNTTGVTGAFALHFFTPKSPTTVIQFFDQLLTEWPEIIPNYMTPLSQDK